jgi:hypothetical protein
MIVWLIRALSLEHGGDDPHALVGRRREGYEMVCAPLALAVINRPKLVLVLQLQLCHKYPTSYIVIVSGEPLMPAAPL